jgi:hypothetical protein
MGRNRVKGTGYREEPGASGTGSLYDNLLLIQEIAEGEIRTHNPRFTKAVLCH